MPSLEPRPKRRCLRGPSAAAVVDARMGASCAPAAPPVARVLAAHTLKAAAGGIAGAAPTAWAYPAPAPAAPPRHHDAAGIRSGPAPVRPLSSSRPHPECSLCSARSAAAPAALLAALNEAHTVLCRAIVSRLMCKAMGPASEVLNKKYPSTQAPAFPGRPATICPGAGKLLTRGKGGRITSGPGYRPPL